MGEGRADAAEGAQIADELQVLHEFGNLFMVVHQSEAQHGAVAVVGVEDSGSQLMLGVVRQARVVDRLYMRILCKGFCDLNGVLVLGPDAHAHGLHGAQGHPGAHGVQAAAQQQVDGIDPVDQFRRGRHAAARKVAVPPEVFGHAVQDDVGAVLQRTVDKRRGKGAVHHGEDTVLPGDCRDGVQIGDQGQGVGDNLGVEHFRVLSNGLFHLFRFGEIRKGDVDSESRENPLGEFDGFAVDSFVHYDVVPVLQQGEQHRGDGSHAGGADQGLLALLQEGNRGAEFVPVWVGRTVVIVPAALVREHIVVHIVENICACRVDRRGFWVPDDALRGRSLIEHLGVKSVAHDSLLLFFRLPPF